MKVKFKKRLVDVEQVNLVRRIRIAFVLMICVILIVTVFYGTTYVSTASNVDSMEHENESSSEFEIAIKDFNSRSAPMKLMSIGSMQLVNYPVNLMSTGGLILATTDVGTTLNNELEKKMEVIEIENEETYIETNYVEETVEETEETEVVEETEPEKEYYLNITNNEKEILCRIVEAEVTGTGASFGTSDEVVRTCKFRIARVIINRVLSPEFPNSVEGVVFQKNQFSPLIDGRYYKVNITDLTREAVDMALDKSIPDDIPGALFFTSGSGFSSKRLSLIKTDDVGHKFYK